MEQHLSIQQLNNLRAGNDLAAELPASSEEYRAFVVIGAYLPTAGHPGETGVPKVRNSTVDRDMRFLFRSYEIDKRYLEDNWDVAEDDLHDSVFKNGITSIEELEQNLGAYLDDFSTLDVSWKRDNPI